MLAVGTSSSHFCSSPRTTNCIRYMFIGHRETDTVQNTKDSDRLENKKTYNISHHNFALLNQINLARLGNKISRTQS